MPRFILRNPAKSTLKVFLGRSLGSVITPAHLLLDTFTEYMLNELSNQALLMLALDMELQKFYLSEVAKDIGE